MKNLIFLLTTLFLFILVTDATAQPSPPSCMAVGPQPFSTCAAVFLNDKMLVDNYSPKGKCSVSPDAKGSIFLSAVELSINDLTKPLKSIEFRVAIVNNQTNTIWQFADETFTEIKLEKIIKKCQVGDAIIFMTVDQQYSLPHNKIEIEWGC